MDTRNMPWWQKILVAAGLAAATTAAGHIGGSVSFDNADRATVAEVQALRVEVRSVAREVQSLRSVVDTLGTAFVTHIDGPAAASLFPGPGPAHE